MTDNIKPLIIIDKPLKLTSMDVVRFIRRLLKSAGIKTKVGYAGTLDPYASGILIVGIGRSGTKQLWDLTNKDKEYVCEIDLLKNSYSGDMEQFLPEYQLTIPKGVEIPTAEKINNIIKTNPTYFVRN